MLDTNSDSLLRFAAKEGKYETVKFLIEKKVDVNKADDCRETALHGAADNGYTSIVACLLTAGADIDKADIDGKTAQQLAVLNGYQEIAKLFIPKPLSQEQKVQKLIDAIQILVATQNEVKHLQQEIKSKQKSLDKAIVKELQEKRCVVKHEKAAINRQAAYNALEDNKYRLLLAEKKAKELRAVVFQQAPVETQKNSSWVVEQSSLDKDKALLVAKEAVRLREEAIANMELCYL